MRPIQDEFALIRLIQKTLGKPSRDVLIGIGDDAAVTRPPKGKLVVTADALVEGVHFDLTYMTARELGHKALAVNLSDIAAMGAKPRFAVVSLGLKQELNDFFVTELYRGLGALAKLHGVDIVGGNLVQSPTAVLVDITVIGESGKQVFTRDGARTGDLIAVTGNVGTSAAGLACLKRLGKNALEGHEEIVKAHLTPVPRVRESLALASTGAVTAMIDISDGLAREIHHIAAASGVGFLIDEKALPVSDATRRAGELVNADSRKWVLYGGEDYELLFTFQASKARKVEAALKKLKLSLHVIGEVTTKARGVKLVNQAGKVVPLEPMGWNHFVRRAKPLQPEYV